MRFRKLYNLPTESGPIPMNLPAHSWKHPPVSLIEGTSTRSQDQKSPTKEDARGSQKATPHPTDSSSIRLNSTKTTTPAEAAPRNSESIAQGVDDVRSTIPPECKPDSKPAPTTYYIAR
jgi:hypothetical protein